MSVFVGIDCGGSSTRVAAVDDNDAVVFRGNAGPANLQSTPIEVIRRNLALAAEGCPDATAVCGCFAGLLTEKDRDCAESEMRTLFHRAVIRAEPDYFAALTACGDVDVCVIAGTGSLVCSRKNGLVTKSGGRGLLLGDQGSSAQIGRSALIAFLNEPAVFSNAFRDSVEQTFGAAEEAEIVAGIYQKGSQAARIAKLAAGVGCEALSGNQTALQIIRDQMTSLAKVTVSHMRKNIGDAPTIKIGLSGGLWKVTGPFQTEFHRALQSLLASAEVLTNQCNVPPVMGAVMLAKELVRGN